MVQNDRHIDSFAVLGIFNAFNEEIIYQYSHLVINRLPTSKETVKFELQFKGIRLLSFCGVANQVVVSNSNITKEGAKKQFNT